MDDSLIGKQVNNFVIRERIGQGGMASVYLAYQPSVNRMVALKLIIFNASPSERDEFRLRFAQEAQVIASLEHVHILPVYDYGIYDNQIAYIAMRLLRGGTLADLLARGPLKLDRTAELFSQIALGLSYAHRKGVIHRDLKPSNIMLDDAGYAYLSDFGLAKIVENSLDLTKSDTVVGTPTYMSPEQLRGEALDPRSDIYSLGCVLYHMLVGHQPFAPTTTGLVSIIYQQLEKDPKLPSELNPSVTPAVEQVVMKALSKNRDARYASAEDMADALNQALGRAVRQREQEERSAAVSVEQDTPTVVEQAQVSTAQQPAAAPFVESRTLIEPTPPPIPALPPVLPIPYASPESSSAVPAPRPRSSRGLMVVAVMVAIVVVVGFIFLNGQNGAATTPTATATDALALVPSATANAEIATSEVTPSVEPTTTEPPPSPSAAPTDNVVPTLTPVPTETDASSATAPAAATQAVAAPAGDAQGQIAFVSDRDGNNEIYLINVDGTGLTRLTDNPAADEYPTWSPDGTKIAFMSNQEFPESPAVYIMDADGSNVHRLLESDQNGLYPAWSPDGAQIAITSYGGNGPEIYLVNADGSNLRKVDNLPVNVGAASWSPDGEMLVFIGAINDDWDLFVSNVDGTGLRTIASTSLEDSNPSWSPVADQIVFQSDRANGNSMIYLTDSMGSDPQLLNEDLNDGYQPAWSPDGTQIAFQSYRAGVGGLQLFVMNADGSDVRQVTTDTISENQQAAWRP